MINQGREPIQYFVVQYMLMQHQYKIEVYSSFFIGHAIPIAKLAAIINKKYSHFKINFITFDVTRKAIAHDFPSINFETIMPQFSAQDLTNLFNSPTDNLFSMLFNAFKCYFQEKQNLPDLIIADSLCVEAMEYAKKNKIKLLVNFPSSYSSFHHLFNYVSFDRSIDCQGNLIFYQLPQKKIYDVFDKVLDSFRGYGRLLINSFIGVQQACFLPPNHTFIGLMPTLTGQSLTQQLQSWINGWKAKGKNKFLYVSFGSVCQLSDNFVNKLSKWFVQLGYPTIWSLKSSNSEAINDPLIFNRRWLPQSAILHTPEVRGYVTHCGWGSISQAISAKTPLACVPIFVDQPKNASFIVNNHVGVQLFSSKPTISHLVDLDISQEFFISSISKLMEDDSYLKGMQRLNLMSRVYNTELRVSQVLQQTLLFGNEHLICEKYDKGTIKTGVPLSKILRQQYLPKDTLQQQIQEYEIKKE